MGVLRAGALPGLHMQPTAQVIDGSLRFNGTDHYLSRSFSAGNRKKWTWSGWVKRHKFGVANYGLFSYYPGSGNGGFLRFSDDDGGDTFRFVDTGNSLSIVSKEKFRDPSAWYHIVIVADTARAIDSDRIKRYVNGVKQTSNASNTWPSLNDDLDINQSGNHYLGRVQASAYGPVAMSNVYFIDGMALGPGYFGFTDPLTNTWRPKKLRQGDPTVNDGTQWSSYLSNSSGASNLFDGDLSTFYGPGSSTETWTPAKPIKVISQVRIYYSSGSTSRNFEVNDNGNVVATGTGTKWVDLNFTGSLRKISGTNGWNVGAIEIDGVILVDSTTTTVDFGTNGFYLPMDNEDDFEIDKSGKGNNWTKNNFGGTSVDPDVTKDSPSGAVSGGRAQTGITTTSSAPGNYCTYNPFDKRASTALSNANLTVTGHNADWYLARCTQFLSTGKYYWEFKWYGGAVTGSSGYQMGLKTPESTLSAAAEQAGSFAFQYTSIYLTAGSLNTVSVSPGSTTAGDTVMFAYDADAGLMWFGVNGTWNDNADPATGTNSDWTSLPTTGLAPFAGSYNTTIKVDANFGQKPFKYAPPQGFLPVNSASATPQKVIPRPEEYVGALAYDGDGNPRIVSGLSMKPDFIWIKNRSAQQKHTLVNSVSTTATGEYLASNAEDNEGTGVHISGVKNGISIAAPNEDTIWYNNSSYDYVALCWKAGGSKNTFNVDDIGYASASAAGLDGGSVTPAGASVGTKQGFSIIAWARNSGTDTISHGLSQAPTFIIQKSTSADKRWQVGWEVEGWDRRLYLNLTDADSDSTSFGWSGNFGPTNTLIRTGGTSYVDGDMIAFCWHDVPGLQKFGKFTGNNDADGVFVELGFRPAILLLKNDAGTGDWIIWDNARDPVNPVNKQIWPYTDSGTYGAYDQVGSNYPLDFLSNGFKMRTADADMNGASTYLYAAWAEAPAFNLYGGQSLAR